jgi:putative oxidoreductase
MATVIRSLQSLGLLIARLGLGGILLLHGWTRWRTQGIARQVDYLNQFGTPYPQVAAWGAVVLELVGGVFLIVGALTPFIGLAVLVQQILTVAYTNWYRTPHLLRTDGSYNGGYEYNVALGCLGLLFFVFGGGALAIDRLFRRKKSTAEDDDDDLSASTTIHTGRPATV